MKLEVPGHSIPTYSEAAAEDALFHYTTATGLVGILTSGRIWSTGYYCTNDESELTAGRGILAQVFRAKTMRLINDRDARILAFAHHGLGMSDILGYADHFEDLICGLALGSLGAYITCFCKAGGADVFINGLLSQWRGYGSDGGYALQFSRKKLLSAIEIVQKHEHNYDLVDMHYLSDNSLKAEVLKHGDAFVLEYLNHLDELAKLELPTAARNPLANLLQGPLETLINYLVHTKNSHFSEERECRMSLVQPIGNLTQLLPVDYFNRAGLLVPYVQTPTQGFDLLNCLEWIVVGPGPRLGARFKSVSQLVRQHANHIQVRASQIPFTRF